MTTAQSAATRLFPIWARELGLGDVRLVGCDLPIHTARERYREAVRRIKTGPTELGALVTTHKIDLFEACRDLFDEVDHDAQLCGETSCLAKRDGRLWARATDPIAAGRALSEFLPGRVAGEVLCLGAGGSALAVTVHLIRQNRADRITVVNRSAARLEAMRAVHATLDPRPRVEYVLNTDPQVNDGLVGRLPPGSLVINATGMGKDTPGSPLTDAAVFPESGFVWDFNYRGTLELLRQAALQSAERNLRVHDGWRYFIHGWAAVMEHVFAITIDEAKIARLSELSQTERPART